MGVLVPGVLVASALVPGEGGRFAAIRCLYAGSIKYLRAVSGRGSVRAAGG
jgi:hypothetical protein